MSFEESLLGNEQLLKLQMLDFFLKIISKKSIHSIYPIALRIYRARILIINVQAKKLVKLINFTEFKNKIREIDLFDDLFHEFWGLDFF